MQSKIIPGGILGKSRRVYASMRNTPGSFLMKYGGGRKEIPGVGHIGLEGSRGRVIEIEVVDGVVRAVAGLDRGDDEVLFDGVEAEAGAVELFICGDVDERVCQR